MSLTVTDLTTLDPNVVEQFRATETGLIAAFNPGVDLKRGPTQDLVITPKAALDAATQTNIDLIRQASSLLAINANPALADTDTVNRLLSNYGLTRKTALPAVGTITVVLSALVPAVIPTTTVFTINGQTYQPVQTTAGRISQASVLGPGDVLITALGSNFSFPVAVQAVVAGSAGNAKNGSPATLSLNPPKFVQAYAQGDITGGQDQETNAQLIGRLQSGLAAKTWGSRFTVDALLRQQFPSLLADSIVGFGDPEMLRDTHAIWPGHTGGRSDLWIRMAPSWQAVTLSKTATLIFVSGTQGTWQFTVARDDAPGYYMVDRVLLPSQSPTSTGFPASSDVRSFDLSVDATHSYFPDVTTGVEGAYSRYQTSTVQFVDTITNASGLTPNVSTATYNVVLRTMPQIAAVQDYLGQRSVRPTMGDVLVRAAVPCFMTVSLTLNVLSGTVVNVAAAQAAVASAVNALGFSGSVPASAISQVLHNLLGASLVSVTSILMNGTLRRLDGTNIVLADPVNLAIVSDPANLVTNHTVAFLLNATDVTITVNSVAVPSS